MQPTQALVGWRFADAAIALSSGRRDSIITRKR